MTAPRRAARLLGSVVVLAATALGPRGASAVEQAEPVLELAAQSAGVDVGGTFSVAVLPAGMPADTELRVTVHDRVRTRTELGTSSEGEGLRRSLHTTTVPLGTLPAGADGRRELGVSLAPATPAGRAVTEPGVYPVALDAVAPSGRQLARVITHLVLRPPASQGTPLAVAVLAHIGAPPRPPDEPALDAAEVADATGLVDALAAVPDVTATLAVTPDTLSELALSGDPEAVALVDALRTAATSRPLLALPYVATSPDALADADLEAELVEQLDHGAAVVRDLLGTTPTQATWIAGSDLGATGLELLSSLGVRRAVVAPGRVDRVTDGVLTPARPFVLAPPRPARGRAAPDPDTPIQALLTDTRLADALEGDEEPALIASHVLAELAMLWFEQPGTPRSIVLELDPEVPREAARGVLDGLRAGSLFRPVALDDAFAEAAPLAGVDGDPLRRALDPEDPEEISTSVADGIIGLRGLRGSIEATVGPRGPTLAALDAHLLRATALGLDSRQRRAELDAARRVDRRARRGDRHAAAGHHHAHRARGHRATDHPQRHRRTCGRAGAAAQPQGRAARGRHVRDDLGRGHHPARHRRADAGLGELPLRGRGDVPRREAGARVDALLGAVHGRVGRRPRAVRGGRPVPRRVVGPPLAGAPAQHEARRLARRRLSARRAVRCGAHAHGPGAPAMAVRIVTDSSCDLTEEEATANGIEVVPLTIRFGDEELEDRTQLSVEAFYERLATSSVLPETAAPAPGKFEAAFRRQAAAGADAVVCINLSSGLSATMQSANNAATAVAGDLPVHVVDSRSITSGLGTQVLLAAEAAAGGASADDVVALVQDLVRRTHVIGALDTLDNLKKGGRIGGAQAIVGSLLSIKPILDISTGEVEEAGRARTRKKALETLRDRVVEHGAVANLHVTHGFAPDADVMVDLLAAHHPREEIRLRHIGPVIGTHGGPRVMGVTWLDPS